MADKQRRYFIVNPAGALHEVTREDAISRLSDPRYRTATKSEVKKYLDYLAGQRKEGAVSRAFPPVAPRWKPVVDEGIDIDALLDEQEKEEAKKVAATKRKEAAEKKKAE